MRWAEVERRALAATFRTTDPESSTLCEGWTARHVLAHLVQREQETVGRVADLLGHPEPGQEKRLAGLVDAARSPEGYEALVVRFLRGPPAWSPMSWAGESLNFTEYVIHHEDVRRGGDSPQEPRALPPEEQQAIWKRLPTLTRLTYRRAPVSVTLAVPNGPSRLVRRGMVGVSLTGDPIELMLYVSGRRAAARVEVDGGSAAVEQFERWVTEH
ncbi:MAG: TIGR03085 family metal-binding protein [Nocardioidaceae bacterium]